MATIFLKDGRWWLNYTIDGKRMRVSTGTSDRRLALLKLKDLELKLFKGEIGAKEKSKGRVPIHEFFRRYVEYFQSNSPVDKHPDLARLRIIQDFLARKNVRYLAGINTDIVDEFRATVLSGRKPKTIKNYITLLKTALNKAVEWNFIDHNPIANVRGPKVVKTFHFYSQQEVARLVNEAHDPLKTAIIILVNTGMRRGELFHLRWRDIDLKNGSVRVWPYGEFSPKGKRPRTIPITGELKSTMRRLSKGKSPDDFVFRPYKSEHRLYKHFAALVKALGMKGTLHDLRHTFASRLAMAGVPIPVIKELLGHSDISTTMIYSHLSPEVHREAINKLRFSVK